MTHGCRECLMFHLVYLCLCLNFNKLGVVVVEFMGDSVNVVLIDSVNVLCTPLIDSGNVLRTPLIDSGTVLRMPLIDSGYVIVSSWFA